MTFSSRPVSATSEGVRPPARPWYFAANGLPAAVALSALSILLLVWGCSSSDDKIMRVSERYGSPTVPKFMTGPASLLLTNVDGFSAELVMQTPVSADKSDVVSGELLGRGGKLLFAPSANKSKGKKNRSGGFLYIWDVASNTGYVLSEALQGYAPVPSGARFGGVSASPARPSAERVDGHPCEVGDVLVGLSNGSSQSFHVWQATDLKGFPARVASAADAANPAFTISFSKIELLAPSKSLFEPPEDFTKYESMDQMMTEIVSRQEGGKKTPSERYEDNNNVMGSRGAANRPF